jgi:hypothetical protein
MWLAARHGVAPRIVVAGGSYLAPPGVSVMTDAEGMRRFLLDLGVPNEAIVLGERTWTWRLPLYCQYWHTSSIRRLINGPMRLFLSAKMLAAIGKP